MGFIQDVRYGVRVLAAHPAFTLVAVLTLALGIGANTAIFSLVDGLWLQPLKYEDPDELVHLWKVRTEGGLENTTRFSERDFYEWRSLNRSFENLGVYDFSSANLTGMGEPERIPVGRVSVGFLRALGARPTMGRLFLPEEELPTSDRVVIVTHGFWERRFGSDESVLGQTITLGQNPHTVIGVLPADFSFAGPDLNLWLPVRMDPAALGTGQLYRAIGRLRDGVSIEAGKADMRTLAVPIAELYPETNTDWTIMLVPLYDEIVREAWVPSLMLLGAVGFFLLIACVNVANLLLARGATRGQEIAVRAALGAGRGRLIRQALTESSLIGFLGGAVGFIWALWALDFLVGVLPAETPRLEEVGIDFTVLMFTLGLSLATSLFFGMVPALQSSRVGLNDSLKSGQSRMVSPDRHRFLRVLVVAEVALALVLLVGAGLMTRSLVNLLQVDPGFDVENTMAMEISLPRASYPDGMSWRQFFGQLHERVENIPGVSSAGLVQFIPLGSSWSTSSFVIEGRPAPEMNDRPSAIINRISSGYFETLGIPLLRGRLFDARDAESAQPVMIISH